jgi:hypothetical protein
MGHDNRDDQRHDVTRPVLYTRAGMTFKSRSIVDLMLEPSCEPKFHTRSAR